VVRGYRQLSEACGRFYRVALTPVLLESRPFDNRGSAVGFRWRMGAAAGLCGASFYNSLTL
jgi:hypothetical protein